MPAWTTFPPSYTTSRLSPSLYHDPLGAQHERTQLALVVQFGRIVRDGAAVRDRVRARRHEYHPVRLLLTIGALG